MYPYIYITLPSYGVMAFIGAFAVLTVVYLRLEKFEVPFEVFLTRFLLCGIGGFVGSKLLFAITQIPQLLSDFSLKNLLLLIPQSGFVFYGGLFGVIYTIMLGTRTDHALRNRIFRMIAPSIPLFHGFGRIGCLLAGCCYGRKLREPILLFGLWELERVPVQIMESVYEFLLCSVLLILERRKDVDGMKIYLISYSVFRFLIEFFRGDAVRGIFFGLSTAQWISIFIIVYYFYKRLFCHPVRKTLENV